MSNYAIKKIRSKLESVMNGHHKLYNTVSKKYILVTEDTIDGMVDMWIDLIRGHGTKHLEFIEVDEIESDIDNYINEQEWK